MDSRILLVILACGITAAIIPKSCPNLRFNSIPKDHLYHSKIKPLIIAHRGQPKLYQENTYDGILSAVDVKADGFELDIYKTKDNKLVVFHDDNTKKLTGVSKIIWESTYEELQLLNLTTTYVAGGETYTYDKPRKIPLLEEILKATKDTGLLHYLEMKPSTFFAGDSNLVNKTGELVADMITRLDLTLKSIVISFDYRKIAVVKSHNPNIVVGTLYSHKFSTYPKLLRAREYFPALSNCIADAPTDPFGYFKFTLNSGLLFKASGSSSIDCDITLYNNAKYSNDTIAMMHKNYSPDISTGFYTVYSLSKTEKQNKQDEIKTKELIKQGGGHRLITDDVPRLRVLVGKDSTGRWVRATTGVIFLCSLICAIM